MYLQQKSSFFERIERVCKSCEKGYKNAKVYNILSQNNSKIVTFTLRGTLRKSKKY